MLFPIEDESFTVRITNVLKSYLSDNVKARSMSADGSYGYKKALSAESPFNSQEQLLQIRSRGPAAST